MFMFLSGTGYSLLYMAFVQRRKLSLLIKNDELIAYIGTVIVFALIIAGILILKHTYGWYQALEEGLFQVTSVITTTGFATVDYTKWPFAAQMILMLLLFTGASAGSASGGLKMIRVVFIFKYIKKELFKILHPSAVLPIRVNDTPVPVEIMGQMMSFIIFYFAIFAVSAFAMTMIEGNTTIGVMGAIATLGNTGPGFGSLGPMGNFDALAPVTKIICIFNMLIGRLELVPFLALLHPDMYNIKK